MRKIIVRSALIVLLLILVTLGGLGFWVRSKWHGSLPILSGAIAAEGLTNDVLIERDSLGVPTVKAKNRKDLAFATGFLHGQERFFQMDLLRRNSAGELAELIGAPLIDHDRAMRIHRFRAIAKQVIEATPQEDRDIGRAYVEGVNAGLTALAEKPFEYFALGSKPAPWTNEDTVLVLFSMYLDLQGGDAADESAHGLLHDLLPEPMYAFLAPRGTEWDAPLDGPDFEVPAVPGPEVMDLRVRTAAPSESASRWKSRSMNSAWGQFVSSHDGDDDRVHPGSNNWAVAGSHTKHGGAIVAGDMHLGISVPNTWYRARFEWTDDDGTAHEITGVTLPGAPAMVAGSNTHVAWALTNSEGDWVDLVEIEPAPNDEDSYLTPDGPRKFEHHQEIIQVAGAAPQTIEVLSTIWGPIFDTDHQGRRRALRWVAHDPAGVNLNMLHLETAATLEQAMAVANSSGSPHQNFTVVDDQGRIGWTILGRIPRRVGFDGRLPTSWADGRHRWDGWLDPQKYPRVIDPGNGRIWTANARVASGEMYETLGDGGYDLGSRASQIRDDLLAIDRATEADMLKIQLDDRALFWQRWQKLALEVLSPEAIAEDSRRKEFRTFVEKWGGRASIDSVGFHLVRLFRIKTTNAVFDPLVAACAKFDPDFRLARLEFSEGPAWRLVSEKPLHLLNPKYKSWDDQLLAVIDEIIAEETAGGAKLADRTWGAVNETRIRHPLSKEVPAPWPINLLIAHWLDMPQVKLPGSTSDMPRIQGPTFGASQRMGVSPGREKEGYFHMPGGQSGHPRSPHYRDGFGSWARGEKTPFLPGKPVNTLILTAAK